MTVTQEDAQARCGYWQTVLRLQDWDVRVTFCRRHDLKHGVARAEIDIYRRAHVRILDPIDQNPEDWPVDRDVEVSLVHELLHLQFYDVAKPKEDTPEDVALERGIEATARALVQLSRGAP